MSDELNEIIRVLQLTTYDEEEWDADQLTVMINLFYLLSLYVVYRFSCVNEKLANSIGLEEGAECY